MINQNRKEYFKNYNNQHKQEHQEFYKNYYKEHKQDYREYNKSQYVKHFKKNNKVYRDFEKFDISHMCVFVYFD